MAMVGTYRFSRCRAMSQTAGAVRVTDSARRSGWNSPGTLYVECAKVGNRWLDEAHAHSALSLRSIPQKYNQPVPKSLTYGGRSLPRQRMCCPRTQRKETPTIPGRARPPRESCSFSTVISTSTVTLAPTLIPASTSTYPYGLYDIGDRTAVDLPYLDEVLERCLGGKAENHLHPMQPGDVAETFADVDALIRDVGLKPDTPTEVGIETSVTRFRHYYRSRRRGQTS